MVHKYSGKIKHTLILALFIILNYKYIKSIIYYALSYVVSFFFVLEIVFHSQVLNMERVFRPYVSSCEYLENILHGILCNKCYSEISFHPKNKHSKINAKNTIILYKPYELGLHAILIPYSYKKQNRSQCI